MEKNLTLVLMVAALLVPVRAGALCSTCPLSGFRQVGTTNTFFPEARMPASPLERAGILDSSKTITGPAGKKMTMAEVVSLMESPEEYQKKKKTIKRREGGETKTSFKITVPEGTWRIIWRLEATDKKESADFKLRVEPAKKSNYSQELTKSMGGLGNVTFGIMNICDVKSRKFSISLDAKKAKWSIEIQSLYD